MGRTSRINKPKRLLAIDSFIKFAMKKGILDIELVYRLVYRPRVRTTQMVEGLMTGLKVS